MGRHVSNLDEFVFEQMRSYHKGNKYDMRRGEKIARKYLSNKKQKFIHSKHVARFAYSVAKRLKENGVDIDPQFVGFLGWVHDVGRNETFLNHERASIGILTKKEGIPQSVAKYVMHGAEAELNPGSDSLPHGLEGKVLSYADMTIRTSAPMSIEQRMADNAEKCKASTNLTDEQKERFLSVMKKSLPRFKSYESEILRLAKASSFRDFI